MRLPWQIELDHLCSNQYKNQEVNTKNDPKKLRLGLEVAFNLVIILSLRMVAVLLLSVLLKSTSLRSIFLNRILRFFLSICFRLIAEVRAAFLTLILQSPLHC